jgi:hypothetical protein
MDKLIFTLMLKEVPVELTGLDGTVKNCSLKELTSSQRKIYNDSFDMKLEFENGKAKAVAGNSFKLFSEPQFLSMCLYDENNKLFTEKAIGDFPAKVTAELYKVALDLSGLSSDSFDEAKND